MSSAQETVLANTRKDEPGDVLFVEDQHMLRFLALEAFGFEGIRAQFAVDGCEAVTYFDNVLKTNGTMPRIVFLDLLLPCMTGQQVYRKMMREPYASHLKKTTLVITSGAEEALTIPMQSPFKVRVLYKPYEVGALIDMVRSIAPDLFDKPESQGV